MDTAPRLDFDPLDPVALTQALIRCPSVTPHEGGALTLLFTVLAGIMALGWLGRFARTS